MGAPGEPQKWIRIPERSKRWHAVYCDAYGIVFTYCARTGKRNEAAEETESPEAVCSCCRSRLKSPFLVPPELQGIRDGSLTPIPPTRQRARRDGEISIKQGKLYA